MAIDPDQKEKLRQDALAKGRLAREMRSNELAAAQQKQEQRGMARFGLRGTAAPTEEAQRLAAMRQADVLEASGDKLGAVRTDPRARGNAIEATGEVLAAYPLMGLGMRGAQAAATGLRAGFGGGGSAASLNEAAQAFGRASVAGRPVPKRVPLTGNARTLGARTPAPAESGAGLRAQARDYRAQTKTEGTYPFNRPVTAEAKAAEAARLEAAAGTGFATRGSGAAAGESAGVLRKLVPGRKTAVATGLGLGAVALTAAGQNDAAAENDAAATGGGAPVAALKVPDPTRSIAMGRNERGELVAASDGATAMLPSRGMQTGSKLTGLRSLSFKPETEADVKKATDASESFYKNIGGDLSTQQAALSQALSDQDAGVNGATRGLRGGAGGGGKGDSPLDFAKYDLDRQRLDLDRGKAGNDADQKQQGDFDAKLKDRRRELVDQGVDLTNPLSSDLAQASVMIENDPGLDKSEAARALRKRLLGNTTDVIEGGREYLADDPNVPLDATNGPTDFSRVRKGAPKGIRGLVDNPLYDPEGTLEYTDEQGNVFNRSLETSGLDPKSQNLYFSLLNGLRNYDSQKK